MLLKLSDMWRHTSKVSMAFKSFTIGIGIERADKLNGRPTGVRGGGWAGWVLGWWVSFCVGSCGADNT